MKTKILILTIAVLMCGNLFSQSKISLKGVVVDPVSKQYLSFASIKITKDKKFIKGDLSDIDGAFVIQIQPGIYDLSISYLGYKEFLLKVDLTQVEIEKDLGEIGLELEYEIIEGVEVKAKIPQLVLGNGKMTLNVAESSLGDSGSAFDVLEKTPGMTTDQNGNLVFRGQNGIVVNIDGKEVRLSGEELNRFLTTIGSESIDKIEIISTPSVKYDASGTAGIINIKTIKSKNLGFNSTIKGGLTRSNRWKYNGGVDFNYYSNSNTNIYGSYYHFNGRSKTGYDNIRYVEDFDLLAIPQETESLNFRKSHNTKLGLDHTINDNHSIGVQVNYLNDFLETNNESNTSFLFDNTIDSSVDFNSINAKQWDQISTNLLHKWTLDTLGTSIETNIDFARFNNSIKADIFSDFYDYSGFLYAESRKNDNPSQIDIFSGKVDLVKPISVGEINAGVKFSKIKSDNNYRAYFLNYQEWINDLKQSNHFIYDENIFATYLGYSFDFKKINLYAGLRSEYSRSKGNSITTDSSFTRDIFELFPSFSAFKNISDKSNVSLSYSKRIYRPDYHNLNPFEIYQDNYSSWRGNPNLKHQISHVFELSHAYNRQFFTTLSYQHTNNMSMPVAIQNSVNKKIYTTYENYGNSDFLGLYLTANLDVIPSLWYMSNNGGVYYNSIKDTRLNAEGTYDVKGIQGYYLSSYNSFSFGKGMSLDLNFRYNGTNRSIWESQQTFIIDTSLKKKFNNGAYVSLMVNDIFGPVRYVNKYKNINVDYTITYKPDSRRIRLNFSYPIGNSKNKKSNSNRKSGIEDEKNRVKQQ